MFNDFLTTEGERLLAKSIAGSATITFTKMGLGDGNIESDSHNIVAMDSQRLTIDIYSVNLNANNVIQITAILKSTQISSGFSLREKGIYATDGTTEILFMYGRNPEAEWIENRQNAILDKTFRTVISLSGDATPKIAIQDGLYATSQELEETKQELIAALSTVGGGSGGGATDVTALQADLASCMTMITDVSNKVGVTNSVAGSTSSGSVMAKINTLLGNPTGYVNNWNMSLKNNEVAVTKSGVYDLFNYTGRGVLEWTAGVMAYSTYSIMPSVTVIVDGVATVENFDMTQITTFNGKVFMIPIKIPFKKSIKIRYNFALNVAATLNFGGILYTP